MESKPKPIVFWPHAFSRAWRQLHVFASNSDWLVVLFTSVAIGQSNYVGFGFATLNWKPLFHVAVVALQRTAKKCTKMYNARGGGGKGGVLLIMYYTWKLCPRRGPFSGWRYIKW